MSRTRFFEEIYKVVKQIPEEKVATYGQIANNVRVRGLSKRNITARIVGNALHNNPDPVKIPCHRVVDRNGKIAVNFAFGGAEGQKKLLGDERVTFVDKMHVDLNNHLWKQEK